MNCRVVSGGFAEALKRAGWRDQCLERHRPASRATNTWRAGSFEESSLFLNLSIYRAKDLDESSPIQTNPPTQPACILTHSGQPHAALCANFF